MTLEGQYLAALGNTATYELSGGTLTLRDSSGAIQATFTAAA
jgi:heat shock protein HslJ